MINRPRFALLVETSGGSSVLRNVVAGETPPTPHPACGHEQSLPDMKQWRGTGIIVRIGSKAIATAIAAARVPAVSLEADPALLASQRAA